MMHLLHVHMLDIVQVVCNKTLGPNCMCIPKTLECLAFGTLSKFVTMSYCNVVFFLIIYFDHTLFGQQNGFQSNVLTNYNYIQQEVFLFCSHEGKPFQQPSPPLSHRWKSGRVELLMIMGLAAFFGITCLSIKFQFRHTMNDVLCHTTHVYAFKHDHLVSNLIHMYHYIR